MKTKITREIEIPEGVNCAYTNGILKCQKDNVEIEKELSYPQIEIRTEGNKIIISCEKANKKHYKIIMSFIAHIKNIFSGLSEKFVYELESANIHFPMSIKTEGNKVTISNFFGEKIPRHAKILPKVNVEIKGNKITVSSHDKEAAGQTVSNLERATKIKKRDRRIFQDGIYLISKPGGKYE